MFYTTNKPHPLVKRTPCAIPGILSPCSEDVVESSAPIPTKRTRFSSFFSIFFINHQA